MPLGVPWPGSTYNEEDKPNWVGHLIKKKKGEPLLVYNFAKGGETVEGVLPQVHHFMEHKFPDPEKPDKITFEPEVLNNALFAIWIGINDVCGDIDPDEVVGMLFEDSIESLYSAGARNFLVFNVPPRIRQSGTDFKPSPGYTKHHDKIRLWNTALEGHLKQLEQKEGVTVYAIDSWSLFTDVFDNPEKYGFTPKDVNKAYGGKMWMDGLHPKSAFHEVIADTVVDRLAA